VNPALKQSKAGSPKICYRLDKKSKNMIKFEVRTESDNTPLPLCLCSNVSASHADTRRKTGSGTSFKHSLFETHWSFGKCCSQKYL